MALTLTIILGLLLLALAAVAGANFRIRAADPPAQRWLLALLPAWGAVFLLLTWVSVARSPHDDWNSARTAPAVAWAMGLPLYYPHGVGPVTDFIHGPVAAVVRLPAAWASTPTGAILIADAINAAIFYLPVVLFLCLLQNSWPLRGLGLAVFWGCSLSLASLTYSAFQVHADAPAVGFALLACAAASRPATGRRRWLLLAATALAAVLSMGSKQNLAPILVILPVYGWLRHNLRWAVTLAMVEALILGLAAFSALRAFGHDALFFQTLTVPSRHPWNFQEYGRLPALLLSSGYLVQEALLPAAVLGFLLLFIPSGDPSQGRRTLRERATLGWFLPLMTAVWLVPSSLIGRAKVGGEVNALTPTTYFLAVALAAWIAEFRPRPGQSWNDFPGRLVLGGTGLLCAGLALAVLNPWHKLIKTYGELADLAHNPQQVAYEFSLRHPNAAYFPWSPLSTLLSDRKYYHFEYALGDYYLARDEPSVDQIRAYLPSAMEYLVYSPYRQSEAMHTLLSASFSARLELPELPPGWIVYARPPPAEPPPPR